MEYKMKLWLSNHKYMAILDKTIVLVYVDDNGKETRWLIFD